MLSNRLHSQAAIETNPLVLEDVAAPSPEKNDVLIRVSVCGVCRTDLHVIEGDLAPKKSPIIPGHQIIGTIEALGAGVSGFGIGDRVGVAWLQKTCRICEYCLAGRQNLCESPVFTGYSEDGGYAEKVVAPQDFLYRIPDQFSDTSAAPLLCAGVIGFRSLRMAAVKEGSKLGLYGFGAAAHVAIQVARHWDAQVFAFTRERRHQQLASELGAVWSGSVTESPAEGLDAAIIFAPAGELVVSALERVKRGGVVVCAGIHMSPIPSFEYSKLYHERVIRSVANNTRSDGDDFLAVAAEIPIETRVEVFPLGETNKALNALKHDAINGAAVIDIRGKSGTNAP
jgi:propanol-preferring alcohol dehydrogenase